MAKPTPFGEFDPACLEDDPDVAVARVALGFTLYLRDGKAWGQTHIGEALTAFLEAVAPGALKWFTTGTLASWEKLTRERSLAQIREALPLPWDAKRPRHLFSFALTDSVDAPGMGFFYREADDSRGRCGYLQVLLPQEEDPARLAALVQRIAQGRPFWCGVGGYVATWNPSERATAFAAIFNWARRHLGLDVQVPDEVASEVDSVCPGTNWLTLLGEGLIEKSGFDAGALQSRKWKNKVAVADLGSGLSITAGQSPDIGDVNLLREPSAYAEVAQVLGEILIEDPPRFWGPFYEDDLTVKWLRRFVSPHDWR